ncbi:Pimeloyl-ACP methyl ester carboxylesterase [Rhizobiales bacterium GAS191]|nr:Pimeloyl-ACP methyl ester carboxylesterase [Rhizobiales bacterium GAS191]
MMGTDKMTMANTLGIALAAVLVAASPVVAAESAAIGTVKNIVLVHGANTDGSAWRGVYDILTKDGYHVSVVQQALTGLVDDVAATKRVIDQQDGPVILVGHSYGGTIITVAGADPKVRALVYVAALQPDIGETTNQLAASMPGTVPSSDLKPTKDGFIFLDPTKFAADVAADLPPAQAKFMANSQMPVAAAAFDAPVTVAAWRDKPSYGIIATADRALNPQLARWMYKRSGAQITEIKGSHLVYVSRPGAVASVIERAARSIRENATNPQ